MLYKHMILDDVGVTKKIWSDYILVTFWLHAKKAAKRTRLPGRSAKSGRTDAKLIARMMGIVK